jgi:hypothetical protein
VRIGRGREPSDWLASLLASRDRTRAAPTFAAAGLYLAGVRYDPRRAPALPGPRTGAAAMVAAPRPRGDVPTRVSAAIAGAEAGTGLQVVGSGAAAFAGAPR